MLNTIVQLLRKPTTWMGICAASIVAAVAFWPSGEAERALLGAVESAEGTPMVPLSGTPETPPKVIVELPPAPPVKAIELPEVPPEKAMPTPAPPVVVVAETTTPVAKESSLPAESAIVPWAVPQAMSRFSALNFTKSQPAPSVIVKTPLQTTGPPATAPKVSSPTQSAPTARVTPMPVIARATAPLEPQELKVAKPEKKAGPVVVTTPPASEKMGGDGEFAQDSHEKAAAVAATTPKPSATISVTPPPAAPEASLPTNVKDVWKVVKRDGHDYVTGGSLQRFYGFATYKVDGKNVWLRRPDLVLKAQLGAQELLINNIKFILSYPVGQEGNEAIFSRLDLCKLIDPVLRPSYIGNGGDFDTVVVDAGHGGHDSGAKGVYGYEKDFTLAMANAVRASLIQRGLKVVMTRSTDVFITLGGRVAIANQTPNSIFVSLHFNSGDSSAATGIETFALSPQGSSSTFMGQRNSDYSQFSGNNQDGPNIALATAVHGQVIHRFKVVDRGIKRARWTVLTGCQRPGILFEGGFVTSPTDCRYIASDNYRKALADVIGDAVVNYRKALGQQRVQRR